MIRKEKYTRKGNAFTDRRLDETEVQSHNETSPSSTNKCTALYTKNYVL